MKMMKLEDIKVHSFVTSMDEQHTNTAKGGKTITGDDVLIPDPTGPIMSCFFCTRDYICPVVK